MELSVSRIADGIAVAVYDPDERRVVGRVVRRVWRGKETWSIVVSDRWNWEQAMQLTARLQTVNVNASLHKIMEVL